LTVAARLARFVVARSWDDVSDPAREELKIRVLDSLGCAFGALQAPPVDAIRAQVEEFGGRPLCTLIGGGESAPTAPPSTTAHSSAISTSTTPTSPRARPAIRATTSRPYWRRPNTRTPPEGNC
jgi:hypothetical protein